MAIQIYINIIGNDRDSCKESQPVVFHIIVPVIRLERLGWILSLKGWIRFKGYVITQTINPWFINNVCPIIKVGYGMWRGREVEMEVGCEYSVRLVRLAKAIAPNSVVGFVKS